MLETKCVGDNYKMLATVLTILFANIQYLFILSSGSNILKMSPTLKFCHQSDTRNDSQPVECILRALYYRGLEQEVQQPGDNSFFQQLVQNKLKLNQDILSAIQEKVIKHTSGPRDLTSGLIQCFQHTILGGYWRQRRRSILLQTLRFHILL